MFAHSFPGLLSKTLKKQGVWYKMFRDKEAYRDLIIVFREGGSIKLPNYEPRSSDYLQWEWHGEAGKAILAISSFLKDGLYQYVAAGFPMGSQMDCGESNGGLRGSS